MRPVQCLVTLGLVALSGHAAGQVIEQRSSVRNPDGSMSHSTSRSYSEASYTGESTGPDGITTGFNVHRDSHGKLSGDEWKAKDGQKLETRKIEGEAGGIGGRTALGGFGGIGSGLGTGLGSGFGTTGFGPGSGFGNHGFGSGIGSVGQPGFGGGYGGFPSGGIVDPGFAPSSHGFGNAGGFGLGGRGTHKTEVDPHTGKTTYTYSESSSSQY